MTVTNSGNSTLFFFGYKVGDLTGTEKRSSEDAFAVQCESCVPSELRNAIGSLRKSSASM